MLIWLTVYGCGFIATFVLITLVIRLEGPSSVEAADTWWYVWLPALVWPFSVPAFVVGYIDFFIRWVLAPKEPPPLTSASRPRPCSRCSTPVPPQARYCGRCGRQALIGN